MARTNQEIDEIEGSPVEYKHQRLNLYLTPIEIKPLGAIGDDDKVNFILAGE